MPGPAAVRASAVLAALLAAASAGADHGALICLAGGPYPAECTAGPVAVTLDGSASRDPAGRPLSYSWSTDCPGGGFDNPALARPVLTLQPAGCETVCEVELEVADRGGKTDHCHASVVVRDTTPPVPAAPPDPLRVELWPPDHRVVCLPAFAFAPVAVADACGEPVRAVFTACADDEGAGVGACRIEDGGARACLRVERDGGGDGRLYALEAALEDACGNRSDGFLAALVSVPHDRGRRR